MMLDKKIELLHSTWTLWEGQYVAGIDAIARHLPKKQDHAFERILVLKGGQKAVGIARADYSKDYSVEGLYTLPEVRENLSSTLRSFAQVIHDDMKSRGKVVLNLKAPANDTQLNEFYALLGARQLHDKNAHHYYTITLPELEQYLTSQLFEN